MVVEEVVKSYSALHNKMNTDFFLLLCESTLSLIEEIRPRISVTIVTHSASRWSPHDVLPL